MKRFFQIAGKILVILYFLFIHVLAIGFIYERYFKDLYSFTESQAEKVEVKTEPTILPTMPPTPANKSNQDSNNKTNRNTYPRTSFDGRLMIPVIGVEREDLEDHFNDERSEGRTHQAMDIMAPLGTPVVAASDGEIAKFFDSDSGGITIYQYSPDKRYVYYYAHLQRRDENVKEGDFVKQGTVIGYVGDTGNAGPGNYHLHFSISLLDDPQRYFEGTNINPYPLLKNGIVARRQ